MHITDEALLDWTSKVKGTPLSAALDWAEQKIKNKSEKRWNPIAQCIIPLDHWPRADFFCHSIVGDSHAFLGQGKRYKEICNISGLLQ